MLKQNVKKQLQELTPAQMELLEFFSPIEIPSLISHFKRVFELATFHCELEHTGNDITSLYMMYELTELLSNVGQEHECCC